MPLTPRLRATRTTYRAGLVQPRHAHGEVQVSLVLRGALRERVSRGEALAGALSLVVKLAGVEHADEYGPEGAEIFGLALHPHDAPALFGGHEGQVMRPWQWLHGGAAVRPMLRLCATARSAGADAIHGDDPAIADLVAALTPWAQRAPAGEAPPWLRRTWERLADEDGTRPSVSGLAAEAGVHPVHLARAFRHWYGRSVSGHLQVLRLRRSARLLAAGARTLSQVAHDAGYTDQPHFCRVFRRELGLSPGAYRRLLA